MSTSNSERSRGWFAVAGWQYKSFGISNEVGGKFFGKLESTPCLFTFDEYF